MDMCPDYSETFKNEMFVVITQCATYNMNFISGTHPCPKTKIGTQGEKDLGNSQEKIEKIPNLHILIIKGQRLVPMTFDLQVH